MAAKKKKPKKPYLLSHSRPIFVKPSPNLSSRTTRTLIRKHHTLQKNLSRAIGAEDEALTASLQSQIDAAGGLETYQRASITGQSALRGGDSSKVLMEWLTPLLRAAALPEVSATDQKLRLLEVGALSVNNACSRSGIFELERIDLHSQHPEILEQDFMQRPLPNGDNIQREGFDVVSLSLVVNYVGDAVGKGEMLRRVGSFLTTRKDSAKNGTVIRGSLGIMLPALFLVLPAACVMNSRYCNQEKLREIMESEGYKLMKSKTSKSLVYYLWRFLGAEEICRQPFGKVELRAGGARNNFSIVMR
ncbi:hypothetical protein MMC19_000558 [Ptychographa xylographoides]|nr:hypothetical protein [Ptychographa xylographoides]